MTYQPSAQHAIEIALALFVIGVMLPFVLDAIFGSHEADEDSGLRYDDLRAGHGGFHQATGVPSGNPPASAKVVPIASTDRSPGRS